MAFGNFGPAVRGAVMGVVCLLLAACGGGGGGGGAPPPSAASQFPKQIAVSLPDGVGAAQADTTFPMYAPTNELPTNVIATGADARFFTTVILASATADSTGTRQVTVRITPFGVPSFDTPGDEDHDNVYRYKLSGMFRGETLTADVAVTIVKSIAKSTIIEGDAVGQLFSGQSEAIKDITGDGVPEIGVSLLSSRGGASSYIISSDFFKALPGGRISISTLANQGSKFVQADGAAINANRANLLSSMPTASGVDILVSDSVKAKMYLYPGVTSSIYANMRGLPNPDTSADVVAYDFGSAAPAEGRLIGDVNGDGRNDILIRSVAPGNMSYGIIFGRDVASSADRQRMATPDIAMTTSPDHSTVLSTMVARLVSDVDGDHQPDLLISTPWESNALGENVFSTTNGRIWLIKSAVLHSATPVSINLDTMPEAQGHRLTNAQALSLNEIPDLDGDGYKTLLFSTTILYGIDGNDLVNYSEITREVNAPALVDNSVYLNDVGDIDGDGLDEFMTGVIPTGVAVLYKGADIANGFKTHANAIPGLSIKYGDLAPNTNGLFSRSPFLIGSAAAGQSGMIGVGMVCNIFNSGSSCGNTNGVTSGELVIIKLDDIRAALAVNASILHVTN